MIPEHITGYDVDWEQPLEGARPPLPRKRLGRATVLLLGLLRAYVFVAVPLVVFVFVRSLQR